MNRVVEILLILVAAFFGGWILAYLDRRAKFSEYATDFDHLLPGMLFGGALMFFAYEILKAVFGPAH